MSEVVLRKAIDRVGLIQINSPEALNALNDDVMNGVGAAVDAYERDDNIGCIVLTGKGCPPSCRNGNQHSSTADSG